MMITLLLIVITHHGNFVSGSWISARVSWDVVCIYIYIDSNPIIKNPITTSSCLRLLPIIPSHGNEYLAKRSITLMLIDIIFVNEKIL